MLHLGEVLDEGLRERFERERAGNPRWRPLGCVPHDEALRTLARARILVVTSTSEGGSNAVSEAIACGVPIVASRIPGTLGVLGDDYPGSFEPGDARALAQLLARCEHDAAFTAELAGRCRALSPRVAPEAERRALARLIDELFGAPGT